MKWRRTREGGEREERGKCGEKKEKQREREVKTRFILFGHRVFFKNLCVALKMCTL